MTLLDLCERPAVTITGDGFAAKLARIFAARPGEWIDGMELARHGGSYAWRSRLTDVRRQFGMQIQNRVRRVGSRKVSEYRWVPE